MNKNNSLTLYWNSSIDKDKLCLMKFPFQKVGCEAEFKLEKLSFFVNPKIHPYKLDSFEVDFGARYSVFNKNTFAGLNLLSRNKDSAQLALGYNFQHGNKKLRVQAGIESDISCQGTKKIKPFFDITVGICGEIW